jgi:hypothetical protein
VTQGTKVQRRGIGGITPRTAAWLAWSLVGLAVALLAGGISLALVARSFGTELQLTYGSVAGPFNVIVSLVGLLTFSVVGAVIASRQPRNAIGWIFCGIGPMVGLNSFTGGYAEYRLASGSAPGNLAETAAWFGSWAWILWVCIPTTFLLLLFPDGRLPSPRWRPVAWCAALGITGFLAGVALEPGPLEDHPQITNPYGVDSPILWVGAVAGILGAVSIVASAVSLVVRMRQAGTVERQQIKWLAYGGAVAVGAIFVGGLSAIWNTDVSYSVIAFGLLGLPVFTGIAIVKQRLYDIDVVINRTLVYGSLTVTLGLVYFGCIVTIQALFRTLTGQERLPQLAVVVSTLAIAALFDPLRRRIQSFIDRRFYRRKYDARKTLEAFSARLRDETDLQALDRELVGVVRETMQPAHVSLWLRPETASKGEQAH